MPTAGCFFSRSAADFSLVFDRRPDRLVRTHVKERGESSACSQSWGTHAKAAARKHVGKRAMRAGHADTAHLHKYLDLTLRTAARTATVTTPKAAG